LLHLPFFRNPEFFSNKGVYLSYSFVKFSVLDHYTGWPKQRKPLPNYQKIVSKLIYEI